MKTWDISTSRVKSPDKIFFENTKSPACLKSGTTVNKYLEILPLLQYTYMRKDNLGY